MNLNLSFDGDRRLNLFDIPNEILPGCQFFTYSYNLLQGKPPFDLLLSGNYHQIFKLTFDDMKISAGSKAYLVPDQLDLPAITGVCYAQSQKSSFASSTTASSMYTQAKERYVYKSTIIK